MNNHLLVSTEWLEEHLNDPNVRIVDIRGHVIPASEPPPHYFNHEAEFLKNHIPGAVFIDWVREITDPADPRHAQIAKPDRYAAAMKRAGINDDTLVVAYDDAGGMFAARLWWSLNYYGHEQVAVLDGGWAKWIAEGRPVTAYVPNVEPGNFVAHPNVSLYRSAQQVMESLHTSTVLMDMRSEEEFRGEYARAERTGHIPGAINQRRSNLLNPDGTILPVQQLRDKLGAVGISESTPDVIVYCNGGVSASFGLLAMRVAGLKMGGVYDGSWKEWGNDPTRPIEK
ncbi:MAG: sulfurtransferase [Anaerolineae bacterium]